MNDLQKKDKPIFLATTAIEEFWNPSMPMLFLGEWCLRYSRKHVWQKYDYEVLPSPWKDNAKFRSAQEYVRNLYEELLKQLSELLNEIHNLSYSVRFWRILIGIWLYRYISAMYDRYVTISSAINSYSNLITMVMDERDFVVPDDTDIFEQYIYTDYYNLQIYSRILVALDKRFTKKNLDRFTFLQPKTLLKRSSTYKSLFKDLCLMMHNKILHFFSTSKSLVLIGSYLPRKICWGIFILSSAKIINLEQRKFMPCVRELDWGKRSYLRKLKNARNEFERVLFKLICHDIPKCFLENFIDFVQRSSFEYPKNVKAILSSGCWYSLETFKYWAASSGENGKSLIGWVHGGNYGVTKDHFENTHESKILDYYYSWGWENNHCRAKILPLSINKLFRQKTIKADNRKTKILWVTTMNSRYISRLSPQEKIQNIVRYYDWQKIFFSNLEHHLKEKIKIRVHSKDLGWDVRERIKGFAPNVEIEVGLWKIGKVKKSFLHSLNDAKLYVCDHLATTYIEALALNKPTILFWHPANYDLTEEANFHFNKMWQVGILYHTAEHAAHAINNIYSDIESWWNDVALQQVRQDFCNLYARISPSNLKGLYNEIKKFVL